MDSLSLTQHSLLELSSTEPGDLVLAALLAEDHSLFNPFGIEPVVTVAIPATSTALATVPAPAPTLLARLGALPDWQRGLLAVGVGLAVVYGLVALVGIKSVVVGAVAL
jgi:hypothetical protein